MNESTTDEGLPTPAHGSVRENNPEAPGAETGDHGAGATCEICGAPGYVQRYPAPVSYTGAWCDKCYARLEKRLPWSVIIVLCLVVVAVTLVALLALQLARPASS